MCILFFQAFWHLIRFDFSEADFPVLYRQVRDCPVTPRSTTSPSAGRICYAVDLACIWYWKQVLCLQRSAATASLLRKHGLPAQLVLGAKQMPFRAHAWVEMEDRVVNDKPYMREIYEVLERC